MNSSRPYLIRALYEWIVDNNLTPYLLVDSAVDDVEVPRDFVENGRIILNISPEATHSLVLGNGAITFNARFSGAAMDVNVPIASVLAIYAKENGQGMMFGDQEDTPPEPDDKKTPEKTPALASPEGAGGKRPSLKIVK
ncbi:MAG: ClpXP protease specificity-enhancing factor [Gammaproteobacteria bacterium]|nr:ClpXP protease specificity-enhancing factor [Gammaproteobacteria bacterium]